MAQDGWNEDRPDDVRPGQARTWTQDWAQYDETRYCPFGETGSISTRSGGYTGEGRPYSLGGRYDLSPDHRAFEAQQQRSHRDGYDADRSAPNPCEARNEEPRTWWDRGVRLGRRP